MATGKCFLRQILLSVFLLQSVLVVFEGKYINKILGSFEKILGMRLILVLLWAIKWRLHVLFYNWPFLDIIFSSTGAAGEPMPRARAPYHMWYPSSVGQGNGEEFNRNIVFLSVLLFLLVCSFCAIVFNILKYVIILWMMHNQNRFLTFLYSFNVAIAILVFSIKINSQRLPKAITQIRFDVIHMCTMYMKQRRQCRNCFFYYNS